MRALLSVANREGISTFARELQRLGVELYATDGTRDHLAADGVEVASVSDLTAVPPLVGGQVRTFHPAIYAGILARRDVPAQLEELKAHGLELLDLVVVNVKSFAPEVGRGHIGIDEAIEMIDVAGAALLGAAARNAAGVVAVSDPGHYLLILDEMRTLGQVSADTRYRLAAEAFSTVAAYYAEIAAYLNQIGGNAYPKRLAMVLEKVSDLPYGENPHQRAAFYRETTHRSGTLADATQIHGRPADLQQPARPRRRLPDRRRLHGADRRHHQAHRPGRHRLGGGARRGLPAGARHRPGLLVRRDRRRQPRAGRRDRPEIAANSYEAVIAPGFTQAAREILATSRARAALRPRLADRGHARLRDREPRLQARRRRPAGRGARRASTSTAASSRSSPGATRRWASSPTCCSPGARCATSGRTRSSSRATGPRSASGRPSRAATCRWTSRCAGRATGRSSPSWRRTPTSRSPTASRWPPTPASPRSSSPAARSATRWRSRSPTGTTWRWCSRGRRHFRH